jgi:hypothetical protein
MPLSKGLASSFWSATGMANLCCKRNRWLPRKVTKQWLSNRACVNFTKNFKSVQAALAAGLFIFLSIFAHASEWPPKDPGEYNFTIEWAKKLKFKSIEQLQKAAGSKGTISERHLEGDQWVVFHWRSEPKNSVRLGYMTACVWPDGRVRATVLTDEDISIVVTSTGNIVCDRCSPPINSTGEELRWCDKPIPQDF